MTKELLLLSNATFQNSLGFQKHSELNSQFPQDLFLLSSFDYDDDGDSLTVAKTHLCKNSPTSGLVGSLSFAANGTGRDYMKYIMKGVTRI